jgi:hypothetical protein
MAPTPTPARDSLHVSLAGHVAVEQTARLERPGNISTNEGLSWSETGTVSAGAAGFFLAAFWILFLGMESWPARLRGNVKRTEKRYISSGKGTSLLAP